MTLTGLMRGTEPAEHCCLAAAPVIQKPFLNKSNSVFRFAELTPVFRVGSCTSFLIFSVVKHNKTPAAGVKMAFAWFKSKSERAASRLIREDRRYLEARARHFLRRYLNADEDTKNRFYQVVEDAVHKCQVEANVVRPSPELEDAQIAMAVSKAATEIFLEASRPTEDEGHGAFRTDAYATVAIAYRRAAGIYTEDQDMRELGTAAVHLLTMATSYVKSQNNDVLPNDAF